jgi:hypothetical protein
LLHPSLYWCQCHLGAVSHTSARGQSHWTKGQAMW